MKTMSPVSDSRRQTARTAFAARSDGGKPADSHSARGRPPRKARRGVPSKTREEKHFLGFVEFIERASSQCRPPSSADPRRFSLHPQRDSATPRFLQQRLAELLSLVIGKSQGRTSLNMTISVLLVILYRAFFWFAMGVEKKSLIKRSAVLQKETTEFR